jgi:UDP-3-O-[3-hydroxymyristoyl] glucosamine N-acyltransferase
VYRLSELARLVQGDLSGRAPTKAIEETEITGAASLEDAGPTEITFAAEKRMVELAQATRAAAVIVTPDFPELDKPVIRVMHARLAWAKVLEVFAPIADVPLGVHESANVGEAVVLGKDVSIQAHVVVGARTRLGEGVVLCPGVYIGEDVSIGSGTVVYPNAVILDRVKVGKNCLIHAGAVLGADGFGFVSTSSGHRKVQHIGSVVVEDEVEIGANSTVDRATTGVTTVGRGTKIDNLVQLGHNVQIGSECLIVALSGVAGSAVVERRVTLAGQSGVAGHLRVGEGSTVASRGLVAKDTPPGSFVSGFPARPHAENMRMLAAQQRLPALLKDFDQLRRRVARLEEEKEETVALLYELEAELEKLREGGPV